ncbi:hypothetical protein ZWY2020_058279 [Hordeum vulgare]|nr:hypothetical protein ZWY2020_058279 [Hordeum vulgare]
MASQQEEEADKQYQRDSMPARRSEQVWVHGRRVDSSFAGECGCLRAYGSIVFGGLDLNLQASFMDLLHSTPADVYGDELPEFVAGGAGGVAMVQGRGRGLTMGHAAWKKLKYGPPENLSELEIMFEYTVVDGSTSIVPGEHMDDEGDIGEEGEDEADVSPLSVSNNKRSSSSTATVSSPKKKIKSLMVRIMKGMYEEMKETNAAAQKAMQEKVVQAEKVLQEKKDSITKCMSLAVESGAFEGSVEHFMMNWSSDDLLEYSSSDDGVVSLYGSDVEDDTVNFARQTLKRHVAIACMIGGRRPRREGKAHAAPLAAACRPSAGGRRTG